MKVILHKITQQTSSQHKPEDVYYVTFSIGSSATVTVNEQRQIVTGALPQPHAQFPFGGNMFKEKEKRILTEAKKAKNKDQDTQEQLSRYATKDLSQVAFSTLIERAKHQALTKETQALTKKTQKQNEQITEKLSQLTHSKKIEEEFNEDKELAELEAELQTDVELLSPPAENEEQKKAKKSDAEAQKKQQEPETQESEQPMRSEDSPLSLYYMALSEEPSLTLENEELNDTDEEAQENDWSDTDEEPENTPTIFKVFQTDGSYYLQKIQPNGQKPYFKLELNESMELISTYQGDTLENAQEIPECTDKTEAEIKSFIQSILLEEKLKSLPVATSNIAPQLTKSTELTPNNYNQFIRTALNKYIDALHKANKQALIAEIKDGWNSFNLNTVVRQHLDQHRNKKDFGTIETYGALIVLGQALLKQQNPQASEDRLKSVIFQDPEDTELSFEEARLLHHSTKPNSTAKKTDDGKQEALANKINEQQEKECLEKERAEKERLEREKQERERLNNERIERERLEREKQEKERLEKERNGTLRKQKEENTRIEKLISLICDMKLLADQKDAYPAFKDTHTHFVHHANELIKRYSEEYKQYPIDANKRSIQDANLYSWVNPSDRLKELNYTKEGSIQQANQIIQTFNQLTEARIPTIVATVPPGRLNPTLPGANSGLFPAPKNSQSTKATVSATVSPQKIDGLKDFSLISDESTAVYQKTFGEDGAHVLGWKKGKEKVIYEIKRNDISYSPIEITKSKMTTDIPKTNGELSKEAKAVLTDMMIALKEAVNNYIVEHDMDGLTEAEKQQLHNISIKVEDPAAQKFLNEIITANNPKGINEFKINITLKKIENVGQVTKENVPNKSM